MAKTKKQLEAELAALKAQGATKPKAAKTRTVKLPPMLKLADAGVAVGVDPKYTNNISVFALKSDGELATKSTGEVKKPKRVPRKAMLAMLDNADKIRELCEFDVG